MCAMQASSLLMLPETEGLEDLWERVTLIGLPNWSVTSFFSSRMHFKAHIIEQGYTYSVFNLVYETNVASCRIWDALGFKRIGRVPGCGNLKSYPDRLVDAIIYGRQLGNEEEDDGATEERFDKIKYYLKHGKYPNGADRAEKSRLRSAATHYKLIPADGSSGEAEKLMLKGKEVVSDPQRQYEVARELHLQQDAGGKGHAGINKTTAAIAEKYHWERIKATVSAVIKNCPECKVANKPPGPSQRQDDASTDSRQSFSDDRPIVDTASAPMPEAIHAALDSANLALPEHVVPFTSRQSTPGVSLSQLEIRNALGDSRPHSTHETFPMPQSSNVSLGNFDNFDDFSIPVDPRIMEGIERDLANFNSLDTFHETLMDGFPTSTDGILYGAHDLPYHVHDYSSRNVP